MVTKRIKHLKLGSPPAARQPWPPAAPAFLLAPAPADASPHETTPADRAEEE